MRAIGKGSLASLLAVGLHIVRIILFVALFGVAMAGLLLPFAEAFVDWLTGFENVAVDSDIDIDADSFLDVGYGFVAIAVILFVVTKLLEILKTLRFGSPFDRANAERFRSVGYALLLGEAAKFAFGFAGLIFGADLDIDFDVMTWIAIIAVFVLGEVFLEGARMKEEQDYTV